MEAATYNCVTCRDKVQWYTMKGELVYVTGLQGKEALEFDYPVSIALSRDGKIYILEKCNRRVQILKGDAIYLNSFKINKNHFPEALAIDSKENVFMVDTRNSCIRVVSPKGAYLFDFCAENSPWPTAIAIDLQDHVYIGNATGVVSVFSKDGQFLHMFRKRRIDINISFVLF